MSRPVYKRIVLKLSGEALQGKKSHGIDHAVLVSLSRQIVTRFFCHSRRSKVFPVIVVLGRVGCLGNRQQQLGQRDFLHRIPAKRGQTIIGKKAGFRLFLLKKP